MGKDSNFGTQAEKFKNWFNETDSVEKNRNQCLYTVVRHRGRSDKLERVIEKPGDDAGAPFVTIADFV